MSYAPNQCDITRNSGTKPNLRDEAIILDDFLMGLEFHKKLQTIR